MKKFKLYSIFFGGFTFLLIAFFVPYSFFNPEQELFLFSSLVLVYIVCLGMFSGIYNWKGTLFLFNLFLLVQFAAIQLPLLFKEFPSFVYFKNQSEASEYFVKYLYIIFLGFTFLTFGYVKGKKTFISSREIYSREFTGSIIYLPFIVSIFCFLKVFVAAGGAFNVLSVSAERFAIFSNLSGYIALTKIGYITCVFLICRGRFTSATIVFILITLCMALIGERGAVLFSGIVPIMVAYTIRFNAIRNHLLIPLVAFFVIFYSVIGAIRGGGSEAGRIDDMALNLVKNTAHHHIAASTVKLADEKGFWLGEGLINIIYAPIPRTVWPNKPIVAESGAVGVALKESTEVDGAGLPPGNFAYSYLQYGLLGVIVFSFMSGWFAGIVENYFLNTSSTFNIVLYTQIQGLVFFIFSTEIQMKIITTVAPLLLIVLLFNLLSFKRKNEFRKVYER